MTYEEVVTKKYAERIADRIMFLMALRRETVDETPFSEVHEAIVKAITEDPPDYDEFRDYK